MLAVLVGIHVCVGQWHRPGLERKIRRVWKREVPDDSWMVHGLWCQGPFADKKTVFEAFIGTSHEHEQVNLLLVRRFIVLVIWASKLIRDSCGDDFLRKGWVMSD